LKTILIIDDDLSVLELLTMTLKANNYILFTAKNGGEALEHIVNNKPDLIILDVMMPAFSGFDIYETMLKSRKIPVIFLTSLGKYIVKEHLPSLSDALILTKPWDNNILMKTIKNALSDSHGKNN